MRGAELLYPLDNTRVYALAAQKVKHMYTSRKAYFFHHEFYHKFGESQNYSAGV